MGITSTMDQVYNIFMVVLSLDIFSPYSLELHE